MKIAYLDCFSGISGDMTIAAFLDAGLSIKTLSDELAKLKIKGYKLRSRKVKRGEIAGTKFDCIVENEGIRGPHSLKKIVSIIDRSSLNKKVKDTAKDVYEKIGGAEAKVHGVSAKDGVRLHQLAEIDSIIDIVGAAIAIDELNIDEVYSSRINMALPSPAALELLKGVPTKISDIEAELVTPTGAGILKALAKGFGEIPLEMNISKIGYGAGTRELAELPNMLRVIIGEAREAVKDGRVVVIEANIDDMNPQYFEYVFQRLFNEGSLDVYITPIQMKRSRPALKLTALAPPHLVDKLVSIIFSETTTIGVRFYEAARYKLERRFDKVKTRFGVVTVKVSKGPSGIVTASPEYEECARIARTKRVPLKVVYDEANRAGRR